ncbi:MAG: hypothetical protein JWP06_562 [Candidatus Saccharibacteria bacterium]|nr:hypothetical protein [Candidatus Saccharibacteria bacterium]
MRISTSTLTSLLLVTAVAAAVPGISRRLPGSKHRPESQFDRLLQHHDRKGDLRAEILGMDSDTFKSLHKHLTLEEIAHKRGFRNIRAFRLALFGKLKGELRQRGWSSNRIDRYVAVRSSRLN